MKFGASIWPFKWDTPYEETIPRIARLGFKAVELIAWDRATLDDYYTPARIRELRRIVDGEGLELSEFVSTPKGLSHPDASVRADGLDHFKRMCWKWRTHSARSWSTPSRPIPSRSSSRASPTGR